MRTGKLLMVLGVVLCLGFAAWLAPLSLYAQEPNRTSLPIPDTQYKYPGKVPLDARDATFPPIKELRPPAGAPNVVVILLDDIGFGAPSTFGGGVNMAYARFARQAGSALYAVSHHRALLADSRGVTDGPQPSFGRDGRNHRTGDQRAGLQRR